FVASLRRLLNSCREEAVLILFEAAEQHVAEQLKAALQRVTSRASTGNSTEISAEVTGRFSAKVELVSFAEAQQAISSLLARFTRVIA
ncbi:MAG: hypothetical protein D3925_20820, partial [Candidatus Electrothrix sp. AR5]|nr:hypothetical protein [Candidatus Electrothrix sp. AR5]